MKKLFKTIVCSLLISTMALSSLPNMGAIDVKADAVDLKQTQIEQILKGSKSSYDLIFYFRDVSELTDSELEDTVLNSQKRAKALLDDAISHGLAEEYAVYKYVNAISVVIHDEETIQQLAALDEVVEVEENQIVEVDFPEDTVRPMFRSYMPEAIQGVEWGVRAVHADKVWDEYGITGEGVTVGIIDTGVNYKLPSLRHSYMGYDPSANSYNTGYYRDMNNASLGEPFNSPANDHGTHVAGIIVGKEADGVNQTGVAPGAKFISAKAVSTSEGYDSSKVLGAFDWLIGHNVDVINCSFGGDFFKSEKYLERAIQTAESRNIAVVISAGNIKGGAGAKSLLYPAANATGGIVVGSVDQNNRLSSFSARGPSPMANMESVIRPDLVAPGEMIRSTTFSGGYSSKHGTSQAAPHVTGVIALLKEAKPDITVPEIKEILKSTAQSLTDSQYPSSPNMGYGYGLVNAYDAVSSALGRKMGRIYGNIRFGSPRLMTMYEEIASSPAFIIDRMPYTVNNDVEIDEVYDLPAIDTKMITKDTKFSMDFVPRSQAGYAYIAISTTGKEEYFPHELEVFELQDLEMNKPVHREFSLSEYMDSSEYVYVRLYYQNFNDPNAAKLLVKGYSVFESDSQDDTILTSSETDTSSTLPISDAANLSQDSSAGPGEVTGTTAPSMEGETASFEAPHATHEENDVPTTVLEDDAHLQSSQAGLPTESSVMLEGGGVVATASEAVRDHSASTEVETTLMSVSNQPHVAHEVLKSQTSGEEVQTSALDHTSTSDNGMAFDVTVSLAAATTRQAEITHADIVENNGIYNDGVSPQSITYMPLTLRNLNVNIPFKPMVKVLNSGKSVYADENGRYELTHSVNQKDKPLYLEVSAYGYETKVIEVDLNIQKDQQQDIVLDPAPLAKASGRLLDNNGNPVVGAIVHILEDEFIENVTTSNDGFYRINAAYRGIYTIMFSKDGYLTKTMRVGLKAGENQLKDVKLYKLSNPVEVKISNGFQTTSNDRSGMEALGRSDDYNGGAVKATPPRNDSILKSANVYFISGDDYRGKMVSIGVLAYGQNGRLVEKIPFTEYRVNTSGWATIDFSGYYLHSTEPVYVVYRYNTSAAQSIGVAMKRGASPDAYANSFIFDGDLTPFASIRNYTGYGLAITTNWLSGVLPNGASTADDDVINEDEFGPVYEYRIKDKVVDVNHGSNAMMKSGETPFASNVPYEKGVDDGGMGAKKQAELANPTASGTQSANQSVLVAPNEEELRKIDEITYVDKGLPDTSYSQETSGGLIANGNKLIQGKSVPVDTVTGKWSLDQTTKKWSLYVNNKKVANTWLRVFSNAQTAQGTHHSWYRFDENGNMFTGFYRDSKGHFYYLSQNPDSFEGQMALGWKRIDDAFFFFRNDGSSIEGAMLTGWYKDASGKRYYLFPDGNNLGKMAVGVVEIQGVYYYFSEEAATMGQFQGLYRANATYSSESHSVLSSAAQSETIATTIPSVEAHRGVMIGVAPTPAGNVVSGVKPTLSSEMDGAKSYTANSFNPITTQASSTSSNQMPLQGTGILVPGTSHANMTGGTDVLDSGPDGMGSPAPAVESASSGSVVSNVNHVDYEMTNVAALGDEAAQLLAPGVNYDDQGNIVKATIWQPTLKENVLYVEESPSVTHASDERARSSVVSNVESKEKARPSEGRRADTPD